MKLRTFAATLVACSTLFSAAMSSAATITQWNFNSIVPDAAVGTGITTPSTGLGTASLVGGVTATFGSGDVNTGSTDPATGDDSGWQTTGYPAAQSADRSAGTQFLVSTVGYQNIIASYDLRHSNTSSRYETLQYTIDGTTYLDAATFDGPAGDTWFNNRSFDFSSVAGVSNNPLFGVRIVSSFATGSGAYAASGAAATYAPGGTWRFDMVTISGEQVVPEPATFALLGLGLVGIVAMRRRLG